MCAFHHDRQGNQCIAPLHSETTINGTSWGMSKLDFSLLVTNNQLQDLGARKEATKGYVLLVVVVVVVVFIVVASPTATIRRRWFLLLEINKS